MTRINVQLAGRDYPLIIGVGILEEAGALIPELSSYSSAMILTHPHLKHKYACAVLKSLRARGAAAEVITVPAGERFKTLAAAGRLYDTLLRAGLDRKALLITVGGGVIGDLGGFVAATYLRGIDFVQAPTTLLAQVDASIGGKTGVDLAGGKNLVGSFHQPRAVLIDIGTLRTLPRSELGSGLAEVIKYGIIADKAFFIRLSDLMPPLLRREPEVLGFVIERSCRIKADVVAEDETEQGRRAILNFGHTVGHALETVTAYRRFKHGEAIAIGMISACLIGEEMGVTPAGVTSQIESLLRSARLPSAFPSDVPPESVLQAMRSDKKAVSGVPRFVLVREIGNADYGIHVPETAVRAALARQVERS